MDISAVDLFCGVGGITHGFIRGGIPVYAGYDNDPSCQYAYEVNNKAQFICTDISHISAEDVASRFIKNTIRVIIGCAPCQPYSTYSYKYKKERVSEDPRYDLLQQFTRIVSSIQPEIVSMENVPDLYKRGYRQYIEFISTLTDSGYSVFQKIVNCDEYGVPQSRKRLVVLASKLGALELIPPTHLINKVTVRDTIAHLESLEHGGQSAKDLLHKSSRLTEQNVRRIKATPEGGSWRDWPKELVLSCHKKDSGKSYPSVYGRMRWDSIAPTITTQSFSLGTGRFGHPEQNRAISLREAALLQTFPENYVFTAPEQPIQFVPIGRHIGNAVPVKLAEVIAVSIRQHVAKALQQ